MRNVKPIRPIKFSMADYDALPKTKRQVLANAPVSFGLSRGDIRISIDDLQRRINRIMKQYTSRDYGSDHPDYDRNYYPPEVRGVNLEKINISL